MQISLMKFFYDFELAYSLVLDTLLLLPLSVLKEVYFESSYKVFKG